MPVILPDMSGARFSYLWMCGELPETAPLGIPAVFAERKWHVARYELSGTVVYARVGWSLPRPEKRHLHLDFARADWFDRMESYPPVNIDEKDVIELIGSVSGSVYESEIGGRFLLAQPALPKVIRDVMENTRVEADGVEVELASGTLSVKGAPIRTVAWGKDPLSDNYILSMTGDGPNTISDLIFTNAARVVEVSYSAFTPKGSGHG